MTFNIDIMVCSTVLDVCSMRSTVARRCSVLARGSLDAIRRLLDACSTLARRILPLLDALESTSIQIMLGSLPFIEIDNSINIHSIMCFSKSPAPWHARCLLDAKPMHKYICKSIQIMLIHFIYFKVHPSVCLSLISRPMVRLTVAQSQIHPNICNSILLSPLETLLIVVGMCWA